MTALLQAKGVAVDVSAGGFLARRGGIDILRGIDLTLAGGEALGLVGESGSGKSTLARVLLGLQAASGGEVTFRSQTLADTATRKTLRRESALMFQDAVGSLSPRMTVGTLVTEPLVIHGALTGSRPDAAARLLDRVGLPAALASRFPHELSGGQARRVGLARALALDPSLIVADEPTAGLDVSAQGEVLNLLTSLRRDRGISLLIITHNLAMIRHVADRIAVLYLGRLVENGPVRDLFADPAHPYTASLIASESQPDPRRRRADLAIRGEIPSVISRPSGCPFHTRCPRAEARCRAEAPVLRPFAVGRAVACHLPIHYDTSGRTTHETELAN
jgi:peptide/nickel transport system ATP-binding protein